MKLEIGVFNLAEDYGWAVETALFIERTGEEEWILFRCYLDKEAADAMAERLAKKGEKVRVRPAKRPCGPRLSSNPNEDEIIPVGPPRVVPPERPPPTAVEIRAERLVEQIGRRILEAPDYYSALGLPRDAKTEDIMDSIRLFISTYHPDVYPKPEAEAITRRLIEIRDTLTDPVKRKKYDIQIGVPAPPTVPVAVGQPVVYCTNCQIKGRLVMMEYKKTFAFETGRSYDIYECPDPTCRKERVANFDRGVFLGFGK